jgi:hypothetical protein
LPEGGNAVRRSVLPLMLLCLGLATGLALLGAGAAISDGRATLLPTSRAAANESLVRAFYGAVNESIATGRFAFDALVAPGFAWCQGCPDAAPTRAGLAGYLAWLRQTAPAAHITVDEVVAGETMVAARVSVSGFPLIGAPAPWGPLDTFRIHGGLIAEQRNSQTDSVQVSPRFQATLDRLPPAVKTATLARLSFAPGAGAGGLLSAGPTVLLIERGALTYRALESTTLTRASTGGTERSIVSAEQVTTLVVGDAVLVPPGIRYELHNDGVIPAEVLGVALVPSFAIVEAHGQPPARPPEFAPFLSVDAISIKPPPDVQLLARGVIDASLLPGPIVVTVGRATLAPGARVVPAASETLLLAVEGGSLGLAPATASADAEERIAVLGDGADLAKGSAVRLRNAGDGPLVLLVLTLARAEAAGDAR